MNRLDFEKLIQELYKEKMIFPISNVSSRISSEKSSLKYLGTKKDYQSLYNKAIRHIFLLLLNNGYDIEFSSVHATFKYLCIDFLRLKEKDVKEAIRARHNNKYYSWEIAMNTREFMKRIVNTLEALEESELKNECLNNCYVVIMPLGAESIKKSSIDKK